MLQIGGKELAEKMGTFCPNIQVLYTSVYTDDKIFSEKLAENSFEFISFFPVELAHKVRGVLDARLCNPAI